MFELAFPLRKPAHVRTRTSASLVQRCGDHPCPPTGCGAREAEEVPFGSSSQAASRNIQSAQNLAKTSGQELPAALAHTMSMALGHDFSRVRVHHDEQAATSAAHYAAAAYTLGSHIMLGANQYQPDTEAGRRLLAHELTHLAQAAQGGDGAPGVSSTSDTSEHEARQIAAIDQWARRKLPLDVF